MIIIINFANKPLVTEQLQKTSNLRIVPTVPGNNADSLNLSVQSLHGPFTRHFCDSVKIIRGRDDMIQEESQCILCKHKMHSPFDSRQKTRCLIFDPFCC